jgi:hypothetical protein
MWQWRQSAPTPARNLRRRLVLGLALLLQIFAVTVPQVRHLALVVGGGVPCPMHPGMMMSGQASHHPGQPASPSNNCPCCGAACVCASVQVALPSADFDLLPPVPLDVTVGRTAPTFIMPTRRTFTAASARGPPARAV